MTLSSFFFFFFFNDTATTEIYTLSLHDALPISRRARDQGRRHCGTQDARAHRRHGAVLRRRKRSEEHTSELQSRSDLVCRLLLEKKKKKKDADSIYLNYCSASVMDFVNY